MYIGTLVLTYSAGRACSSLPREQQTKAAFKMELDLFIKGTVRCLRDAGGPWGPLQHSLSFSWAHIPLRKEKHHAQASPAVWAQFTSDPPKTRNSVCLEQQNTWHPAGKEKRRNLQRKCLQGQPACDSQGDSQAVWGSSKMNFFSLYWLFPTKTQ